LIAVSKGGPVTGTLIDRRPLEHGGHAKTSAVPVTIDGASGTFAVPAARLGDPAAFDWTRASGVLKLPFPLSADDVIGLDTASDAQRTYGG
jgi:hypothetical protein